MCSLLQVRNQLVHHQPVVYVIKWYIYICLYVQGTKITNCRMIIQQYLIAFVFAQWLQHSEINFKTGEHTADVEICCFKLLQCLWLFLTCIRLQAQLLFCLNIMPWRHIEDVKVKVYGKWFRRSLWYCMGHSVSLWQSDMKKILASHGTEPCPVYS